MGEKKGKARKASEPLETVNTQRKKSQGLAHVWLGKPNGVFFHLYKQLSD